MEQEKRCDAHPDVKLEKFNNGIEEILMRGRKEMSERETTSQREMIQRWLGDVPREEDGGAREGLANTRGAKGK